MAPDPSTSGDRARHHFDQLERLVRDTIKVLGRPASIRDIMRALAEADRADYHRIRDAANRLTDQHILVRERRTNAYRYVLNTDHSTVVAQQIAELLSTVDDPTATLRAAQNIVAASRPRAHPA